VVSIRQELDFKTNQLNDLTVQVESSRTQMNEAAGNIDETATQLSELETSLVEACFTTKKQKKEN
jgi:chromosome segregation protein